MQVIYRIIIPESGSG